MTQIQRTSEKLAILDTVLFSLAKMNCQGGMTVYTYQTPKRKRGIKTT